MIGSQRSDAQRSSARLRKTGQRGAGAFPRRTRLTSAWALPKPLLPDVPASHAEPYPGPSFLGAKFLPAAAQAGVKKFNYFLSNRPDH